MFEEGNSIDLDQEFLHPGLGSLDSLVSGSTININDVTGKANYYSNLQIAHILYGPSYISFASALCYWSIIPEYAFHVSSAICKRDSFNVHVEGACSFYFTPIPQDVFLMYVDTWYDTNGNVFCHMATPEKAVCDQLYILPEMEDIEELQILMYEDQRFHDDDIAVLDRSRISDLADHYGSKNVCLLDEYLGTL